MAKVLGLGGVFIKVRDQDALRAWYRQVLDLDIESWGKVFEPAPMAAHPGAATVFSFFKPETDYFDPSKKEFMINLAVDDLAGVLARAKAAGVEPVRTFPDEANGRFAHIVDPEGTKIELWEPKPMSES